jgi:predicted transcriptional regulator
MKKSNKSVIRKRPGRPATGQDPVLAIRLPAALVADVDQWAGKRDMTRSAAIRRWIENGLSERWRPATAQERRSRRASAADMAGETIDRLADPAARRDDQAKRKRRLLKGPEEFRDLRGDQPKSGRPKGSKN